MRRLLWIVPVALFLLNPSFACSDEPQFQYGAAEMRAAIEGDWSLTITPEGGAETALTVHVGQAATAPGASAQSQRRLVRAAHACGTRTLVKGAEACVDVSEMPLDVRYVSGDTSFSSVTMSGSFRVAGLVFSSGTLELRIGEYQILSEVSADGTLREPRLGPLGAAGTLAMSRL